MPWRSICNLSADWITTDVFSFRLWLTKTGSKSCFLNVIIATCDQLGGLRRKMVAVNLENLWNGPCIGIFMAPSITQLENRCGILCMEIYTVLSIRELENWCNGLCMGVYIAVSITKLDNWCNGLCVGVYIAVSITKLENLWMVFVWGST